MKDAFYKLKWIRTGSVSGIIAAGLYPLILYVKLPEIIALGFNFAFGLSLALCTYSIYLFSDMNRKSVINDVAAATGIFAAFIFILSSAVNLSLLSPLEGVLVQGNQEFTYTLTSRIHRGMDFLWNILFASSLFLYSLNVYSHPKLGKAITFLGILIALIISGLYLYFFPYSPQSQGLPATSSLTPVWHFVVSLLMIFSGKWISENIKN